MTTVPYMDVDAHLAVAGAGVSASNPVPVGAAGKVVDVTLTLDTAIYADGDVLAEAQEVASAMRANGGTGQLYSAIVIDTDDQGEALDLWLFDSAVTLGTENGAPSISDADAAKCFGKVSIAAGDYYDLGGVRVAVKGAADCGFQLKSASGSTSIYLGAISRGTGTYTASGIVVRLGITQD